MDMLADVGIYVICDLSDPTHSIDRINPTWETGLYSRYVNVIDEMAQFNNTIGFFAGNEVANSATTTNSSAFVKAAVRDMKAYIRHKRYRHLGVGYATNDDADIRVNIANYFNCEDPDDSVDFWGYNVYSWCGDSTYDQSGYKDRTDEFRNYSVPVFFAEYGCNAVQPRKFTEIDALYRDPMDQVWSGGIIYMYFQEVNNYGWYFPCLGSDTQLTEVGLVSVVNDQITKLWDFGAYSQRIGSANPTGIDKASYTSTNTALQACPTINSKWAAAATPLPPTPDPAFCDCMVDAAGCVLADSVPSSKYGELFQMICGITNCTDIVTNSMEGKYGNYSMCDPKQQLNIILNKYYLEKDMDSNSCHFDGSAMVKHPSRKIEDCKYLARKQKEKEEVPEETVDEVSPETTSTDSSTPCSCTCMCMGIDSASSPRSRGGVVEISRVDVGIGSFQLGIYVITAIITGLGMVLL